MKNTRFQVQVIFGDIINKNTISPEQITKLNIFLTQNGVNIKINFKINLLEPKKVNKNYTNLLQYIMNFEYYK